MADFTINRDASKSMKEFAEQVQVFADNFEFSRNVGNFRKKLGLSKLSTNVSLTASVINRREINAGFNNINEPIVQRIVGASVRSYHGSTYDAIAKSLNSKGKSFYDLNKVKKGDVNFNKGIPRGDKIARLIRFRGLLPISALKFKLKYRDPKKSAPYNFHWGAAAKFTRFGVVQVTLPGGKRVASGRKNSRIPFHGIGFEPIGVKPKESAKTNQYRIFRRVGYPGRASPDTLKSGLGFRVFNYIYAESTVGSTIHNKIDKDLDTMVDSVTDDIVQTAIDHFS